MPSDRPQRTLLFFVAEDWLFCSHRLPLALGARDAGFQVSVITREDKHGDLIRSHGLRLIPIPLSRQGTNPLKDLALIARLVLIYRREKPDILHQVAIKPVIYGSLAARLARVPKVVNAMTGLGSLFSSHSLKARLLQPLVKMALRFFLGGPHTQVIVQNPDNEAFLTRIARLDKDQVHLIRGSGVDTESYRPEPEPPEPVLVLLPARLLWNKGIGEFAEAARLLRSQGCAARFVLAGPPDSGNPAAISEQQIQAWTQEDSLEWWGHCEDMPRTFARSHIVCLPSYSEGLPKALIEAAACGRPIVTTDVPGCREVVRNGENGLLVPVGDSDALADALRQLIMDQRTRRKFGQAGRARAVAEFTDEKIREQTLPVYEL